MFNTFLSPERLIELYGASVCDLHGERLGSVGHVYVDDGTGHATWATARSGIFGRRDVLVPLQGAKYDGQRIMVPFDAATIAAAPLVEVSDRVSPLDEDLLLSYYAQAAGQQQQAVADLVSVYRRAVQAPTHRHFASQGTSHHGAAGECDSRFVSYSSRPLEEPERTVSHLPAPYEGMPRVDVAHGAVPSTMWEGDATERDMRMDEDIASVRDRFLHDAPEISGWGAPALHSDEHVPTAAEIVERSAARRAQRGGWAPRPRAEERVRETSSQDSTP